MHCIVSSVIAATLFYFLIPGVLFRIPAKSSNFKVCVVHAILFGVILYFSQFFIHKAFFPYRRFEGMNDGPTSTASTTATVSATTTPGSTDTPKPSATPTPTTASVGKR
jgi:hypothetical protein